MVCHWLLAKLDVEKALNEERPDVSERWYWNSSTTDACPRCWTELGGSVASKKAHYKKAHYHVYYYILRNCLDLPLMEKLTSELLGDKAIAPRMCIYCVPKSTTMFGSRMELYNHICRAHPHVQAQLCDWYCQKFNNDYSYRVENEDLHRILLGHPEQVAYPPGAVGTPNSLDHLLALFHRPPPLDSPPSSRAVPFLQHNFDLTAPPLPLNFSPNFAAAPTHPTPPQPLMQLRLAAAAAWSPPQLQPAASPIDHPHSPQLLPRHQNFNASPASFDPYYRQSPASHQISPRQHSFDASSSAFNSHYRQSPASARQQTPSTDSIGPFHPQSATPSPPISPHMDTHLRSLTRCQLCNWKHRTAECRRYKTVLSRANRLRNRGICLRCLKKSNICNHDCAEPKCSLCPTKAHNRVICPKRMS